MFGFFIIRKLCDISCISDHVEPISKPLSVVLAECGHLVYAGIFMWPLGLCRYIPALSCVHPGLCRNMPAEPEPFDHVHAHAWGIWSGI